MPTNEETYAEAVKKLDELRAKRAQINANLEVQHRLLNEQKAEAQKNFGTDDPEKLEQMASEIESEVSKKITEMVAELEKAEAILNQVNS